MKEIQSATFKLTLSYLGIIMVLSLLFSVALYRLSYNQMANQTTRQINNIERLPLPIEMQPRRDAFVGALETQLDDSRRSLLYRLGALNLAMLLAGGGASYWLARRTLKPVQNAVEAQGRFTADASHELRTPLTAMRSEIEVALREKGLTAADARELLGSNLEEIAKLEALSAGLLRLARFENRIEEGAVQQVAIKDLFEGAIDRHQARLADNHIELDVETGDETVSGDKASLVELIAILLDNAIKYSPKKSKIALRSIVSGNNVVLSVQDHGVGIKATDVPNIFTRFYRADRSRSKEHVEGHGLGLSIAHRITELHHGTISVDSTPGSGSTFHVRIPVRYEAKKDWFL